MVGCRAPCEYYPSPRGLGCPSEPRGAGEEGRHVVKVGPCACAEGMEGRSAARSAEQLLWFR